MIPKFELKPHQKQGVQDLLRFGGVALLAGEMGVGKTAQALSWARKGWPTVAPVLIVVPANAKLVWEDEIKLWLGKRCAVIEGNYKAGRTLLPSAPIWIVNYDILPSWVEQIRKHGFQSVIIDEVHYCKNHTSKRYQALRKALGRFVGKKRDRWIPTIPHRIAMSGTPLTNRPSELWPTLFLLWPDVFPHPIPYFKRYCRPRWTPWGIKYDGAANLKELHARLLALGMIRQRKKDCLKDLPPKVRRIIHVEIPRRKEYEFAKENFLLWLSRKSKDRMKSAKRAQAFTQIGYLLRFVSRAKLRITAEWISNFLESSDDKLVVFAFNRPALDALHKHFGPKISIKVDGSVKGEGRRTVVRKFQTDLNCRLALCQGKAAGVALTLTAASDILMHDYPWSAGDFLQIEDRIHRIGQTKTCFIHCLVAQDTIEEKVIRTQRKKMKILEKILDGEGEITSQDMFQIEQSLINEITADLSR